MGRISNEQAVTQLKTILRNDGVRPALIFLNHLTEHRFSALYQFKDDQLRNLYFYDRECPEVESTDEIPVTASYCVFLRETGALFHTRTPCVTAGAQPSEARTSAGVLRRSGARCEGKLFGSICHFDLQPRVISDHDVDLMEAVALLLRDERSLQTAALLAA
jgi:hypothetical protein